MEIKIAEPIQTLEYLRDSGAFPFNSKEGVLYTVESIDVAISTMRKYKKIEQIVDRPTGNNAEEKAYNYMMIVKDIKEVLEDGKISRCR